MPKGYKYWLGKKRPDLQGVPLTEEHRQKISTSVKGFKHTEEAKKKMSEYRKANPTNYWFGKKRPSPSRETKIKMSNAHRREKHWNWLGGYSVKAYPVDWSNTLKRSIRERDKYTCQLCSAQQGEQVFHVHHIDYNQKNCNPNNLVTLCHSCHSKTSASKNRKYWIDYFNKRWY